MPIADRRKRAKFVRLFRITVDFCGNILSQNRWLATLDSALLRKLAQCLHGISFALINLIQNESAAPENRGKGYASLPLLARMGLPVCVLVGPHRIWLVFSRQKLGAHLPFLGAFRRASRRELASPVAW